MSDYMVCGKWIKGQQTFKDNIKHSCSKCKVDVCIRPHSLTYANKNKLKIVCLDCVLKMDKFKDADIMMTKNTYEEVSDYFKKRELRGLGG